MAQSCQIPIQVLDVEAATDAVIASVCDYWASLNGGKPAPRRAFEFMEVYKAAPHLLMAERVGDHAFKFIYCGTAVAHNFPLDLTGKIFSPETMRVSGIRWPMFFSQVLDTPCLRYGREPIDWPNDEYAEIIYGICPLTSDTGVPSHVVACLVFVERSPYAQRV